MSKYTTQDLSVSPDARRMGVSGNVIPISSVRAIMLGGSYSATEKELAEEVAASFQLAKTVAVLLGMPEETSIVDLAAALKAKMQGQAATADLSAQIAALRNQLAALEAAAGV